MISVAMATYNGEAFIGDQLESLARQRRAPCELVVGDDGSTDATLKIVADFAEGAPFPVQVHRNEATLGYARNFLETAKRCRGDWIAFCDQDDVWLPNKLEDTTRAIGHTPDCTMVLQNAWICDGTLSNRGRKFPDRIKPGPKRGQSQYGFWVWLGCLQTVHRNIIHLWDGGHLPRNYFPSHDQLSHDKWTCLVANAVGGIYVLSEPAALYRRHASALTGYYNQQTATQRITKSQAVSAEHYDFLADVAEEYSEYLEFLSERAIKPKWSNGLRESSAAFRVIELTQEYRAKLYRDKRFAGRISAFMQILKAGGYVGRPFHAMGLASAAKDAVRVARGARR